MTPHAHEAALRSMNGFVKKWHANMIKRFSGFGCPTLYSCKASLVILPIMQKVKKSIMKRHIERQLTRDRVPQSA